MEQSSSSVANKRLVGDEIPRLLWNTKVHYRDDKSPPLDHIMSQMHPINTFPPFFPKIHSENIFPSTA
jgi:hypothetical protein